MEPGPELDRLVAEAIGAVERDGLWWIGDKNLGVVSNAQSHDPLYADEVHDVWMPSMSAEDALLAADAFRDGCHPLLFEFGEALAWHHRFLRRNSAGEYEVFYEFGIGQEITDSKAVSRAETPAHAICLAILKLAKEPQ